MSYDQFFKAVREAKNGDKKPDLKPRRKKAPFPIAPLLFLGGLSALLGWWSVDPELPDRFVNGMSIRMMGAAAAADNENPAKTAQTKDQAKAKSSTEKKVSPSEKKAAESPVQDEDFSHLDKLRERKIGLDQREKELGELEEELHKQKLEIESRIKQLEMLRAQITTLLKDRVEMDQEKVMKLVETYSNMKPKQAAEILAGVDEDLAVEVLGRMKKKNAAEIMNLLEPAKARTLSEKYAGYKAR